MPPIFTFVGLFFSSALYALLLSTPLGRRWADEQTWSTVVVGVTLVVAWIALEDWTVATKVFTYFGVAAGPIVFRSLWLQLERIERIYHREIEG